MARKFMIANKKKETIFLQTVAGCQMKKKCDEICQLIKNFRVPQKCKTDAAKKLRWSEYSPWNFEQGVVWFFLIHPSLKASNIYHAANWSAAPSIEYGYCVCGNEYSGDRRPKTKSDWKPQHSNLHSIYSRTVSS